MRIRPLQGGGTTTTAKNELCALIYDEGIKFSRMIPTRDTFTVVCLSEEEVDLLIATNTIEKLRSKQYEVIVPPHLKARKTVVIKRLDRDVTMMSEEALKQDLEMRNCWVKVEEIVKFPNMQNMLKVRFSDIKMARKAVEMGLSIHTYHLNKDQVEMEEFIQLTPCWTCYKYEHSSKDCPEKNIKKCSECASIGHTFRECTERTNYKCLNCDGPHRTLAAVCPIRKLKIKDLRNQRRESKKQFEIENRTYCAVAKLGKELPKLREPEKPNLNLNTDLSFKAMIILIHAHLANIARPGSFGKTVKTLLRQNNLPEVNLPDDAPSAEIFRVTSSFPCDDINVHVNEETEAGSEVETDSEEEEIEVEEDMIESIQKPDLSTRSKLQQQNQQQAAAPPPPPQKLRTPKKSRRTVAKNLGLEFFASSTDNIQEVIPPAELVRNITQGRVKFTYCEDIIPEQELRRYFAEGRLSTERYPIQTVDRTTFKKIRSGLRRSPGDQERRRFRE